MMNLKNMNRKPGHNRCLDTAQLNMLEKSFREWVNLSFRADILYSRRRILIIFLLIRYTGAKLNEVLAINPSKDISPVRRTIRLGSGEGAKAGPREVQVSEALSMEINELLDDRFFKEAPPNLFRVDPGFVRRKFYERGQARGFSNKLCGPEMIRKARALELMQGNLPLPAVQSMLGPSAPHLTSTYPSFSRDEIQQLTRMFLEREALRTTSARNAFLGKIISLRRGDIQARVELTTMNGYRIVTMITNESLERLALRKGRLMTAEVKAPWVILEKGDKEPASSAENRFNGVITRIATGELSSEYVIRLVDGTELCAIVSTGGACSNLNQGDHVWAMFNCFAVVLHAE